MRTLQVLMLISVVLLVSCAGGKKSSPGESYKQAMTYMAEGEFEKVLDYVEKPDGTEITPEEKEQAIAMYGMVKGMIDNQGGMKNIEITGEEISEDGNTAKVSFTVTFGNGETSDDQATMVKVNGKWKVKSA